MPTTETLDDLDGEPHADVFPGSEPKTIRLRLAAGEYVDSHQHPGRDIVLYVLSGSLELTLDGETRDVEAGDIARFEGERDISPRALEDSSALIVLAPRAE